ncbi:putative reverse transcriptase domain-containing protein, partial [Tanacetum coccineum]
IAKPLTLLTQKYKKYEWGAKQEEAFQTLKDNLCNAPILSLPDGIVDLVVYCDASNQGLGCVLMQRGKGNDTRDADFVAGLHDVHKVVHENLVCANSKYKQDADHKRRHVDFKEGDFVIKGCFGLRSFFLFGEYNKLSAKKISPLEIMEKINSNAYRQKLPSHIRCSDVFNVKHLIPYHGDSSDDDFAMNSRMNFVYSGE